MEKKHLAIAHGGQDMHGLAIDESGVARCTSGFAMCAVLSAILTSRPIFAYFPGIRPESIKVHLGTRRAAWTRLPIPLRIISGHAVVGTLLRRYLVGKSVLSP